ncbi:MAG: hypothetical protein ABSE58_06155 [Candidatus Limnocylindrales bacterium]|jgi:hypothetical protein
MTRPVSTAKVDLLDRALGALFSYRSGFLAKASGGDTRIAAANGAIEDVIELRRRVVDRLRAQGLPSTALAKIASSDQRLAKMSGVLPPRSSRSPELQAERAFQARVERSLAVMRPDEYHPERRGR